MPTTKLALVSVALSLSISTSAQEPRRILPTVLEVREGEDMQLHLTKKFQNEASCYVKTSKLVSYNTKDSTGLDDRISHWSEDGECGVIVNNVRKEDDGRWRLTSKSGNKTIVDVVDVKILDRSNLSTGEISILSGLEYDFSLADHQNYCTVKHPLGEDTSLTMDECQVTLKNPTIADAGEWAAQIGVDGQIHEVIKRTRLNVFQSQVDAGYNSTENFKYLYLFCNVVNENGPLKLCRFVRPDVKQTAFRPKDGLRKGRYGYYGSGLADGECGLSIESPEAEDYGRWQCTLQLEEGIPFGSFITVSQTSSSNADVITRVTPTTSVMTQVGKALRLECSANVALSYCWFSGPNDIILKPWPSITEFRNNYRYTGNGFGTGSCGVEIEVAKKGHTGAWSCHMGPALPGIELKSSLDVKITETPLAAIPNVLIVETIGDAIRLTCRTVPDKVALRYCRFYSPDNVGYHVNEDITKERSLPSGNGGFWFTGSRTNLGDCVLNIGAVTENHIGNWTCAARIEGDARDEAFDFIQVQLRDEQSDGSAKDVTASAGFGMIMGIVLGSIIVMFAVFLGVQKYRRYRRQLTELESNSIDSGDVYPDDIFMRTERNFN